MKKGFLLMFIILLTVFACRKHEGIGGDGSIRGKVFARHYNSTFSILINESYYPDTYVYIIYGDDINYGQRIKTNYKGEFEFRYLYEGNYKIYTYSLDSAAMVNGAIDPVDSAVIREVTITKPNEIVDIVDMIVFR